MNNKNEDIFNCGLLVGRFQMPHKGHQMMIDTAIKLCSRVCIFIGSSQESGTIKNPFSYELRRKMLYELYGKKICVAPLNDIGVGNVSEWGDYVLSNALNVFGCLPDLIISGFENRRSSWFDHDSNINIAELVLPKKIVVSASLLRDALINDDFDLWSQFIDNRLYPLYNSLRELCVQSCNNTNTISL